MTNLNCNSKDFEKHRNFGIAISHKIPAPEYPTAGAGVGVDGCADHGKPIGPVFSSVEKAQDYLSRR